MGAMNLEHDEGLTVTSEEAATLRRVLSLYESGLNRGTRSEVMEVTPQKPRWGNASSLGISVFAVANTMIALHLMQVRGIQHTNVLSGILWFTGGVASWLSCIFELLMGNTFAYCVFGSFGGYYFAYAATLTPAFAIAAGYSDAPEYANSMGVFFCVWASLFLVFLVVSLRTNLIFVWIFLTVDATAWCLAASNFQAAAGDTNASVRLAKTGGGLLFACSMAGWYLLLSQLFEGVDFPIKLPVGSLTGNGQPKKLNEA